MIEKDLFKASSSNFLPMLPVCQIETVAREKESH